MRSRLENRSRGLTLIEVMVTLSIFFTALLILGKLFELGSRLTGGSEERNDLQNSRLQISSKLQKTLANSFRSGNTAFYMTTSDQDDLVLCLISQESWDDTTQQAVFNAYKIYYRGSDDTLRYLEIPIASTSVAEPLSEIDIRDAISSDPGMTVAESLTSFQLFLPSDGSVTEDMSNPLGLRLTQLTSRGTPLRTELTYKGVTP